MSLRYGSIGGADHHLSTLFRVDMGDPFVRPGIPYADHIEELVLRNEGTGTADTTRKQWVASQHRDTIATMIQRYDQLLLLSLNENCSTARMKRELLSRLIDPMNEGSRPSTVSIATQKRPREE